MKIDLKQILKDEANWKHENFGVVAYFISGLGENKDGVVEIIDALKGEEKCGAVTMPRLADYSNRSYCQNPKGKCPVHEKVEVLQRKDNETGCMVANGILICHCGKCKLEDYSLPKDFPQFEMTNRDKMAQPAPRDPERDKMFADVSERSSQPVSTEGWEEEFKAMWFVHHSIAGQESSNFYEFVQSFIRKLLAKAREDKLSNSVIVKRTGNIDYDLNTFVVEYNKK